MDAAEDAPVNVNNPESVPALPRTDTLIRRTPVDVIE